MTTIGKPVSFLATENSAKSRVFYETVLGLECRADEPYALVFELGDRTLRIQKVDSLTIANHTVLGWEVVDVKSSVTELSQRGVQFETFSHLPQDDLGIWASPGGASIAWFKDPDGNTLSLTQL